MMDKKQWVIKALTALEDVWEDATILKRALEEDIFDDSKIEILINSLEEAIKNVKDKGVKVKMEKGLDFIKKINNMEEKERETEEKELLDMEAMMENM